MRRLVSSVVVYGRHGVLPFVGSAAPIVAFMATKGGGRTGPARRSEAEAAEAKRRMAGAGYFAWRCKGASAPTENSRRPPLPDWAACRTGRPLKKAVGAVLSDGAGMRTERRELGGYALSPRLRIALGAAMRLPPPIGLAEFPRRVEGRHWPVSAKRWIGGQGHRDHI